jgi:hypothetical protein
MRINAGETLAQKGEAPRTKNRRFAGVRRARGCKWVAGYAGLGRMRPKSMRECLRLEQPRGRKDLTALTEPEVVHLADCALESLGQFGSIPRSHDRVRSVCWVAAG